MRQKKCAAGLYTSMHMDICRCAFLVCFNVRRLSAVRQLTRAARPRTTDSNAHCRAGWAGGQRVLKPKWRNDSYPYPAPQSTDTFGMHCYFPKCCAFRSTTTQRPCVKRNAHLNYTSPYTWTSADAHFSLFQCAQAERCQTAHTSRPAHRAHCQGASARQGQGNSWCHKQRTLRDALLRGPRDRTK